MPPDGPAKDTAPRAVQPLKLLGMGAGLALALLLLLALTTSRSGKQDVDRITAKVGAPAALPETLNLDLGDGVQLALVLIRPGEFEMGGNDIQNASPAHPVTITRPFYLGQYEVTQAQYEKVMRRNPAKFKGADLPVEQVSWDDCTAFCKALEQLQVQPPLASMLRAFAPLSAGAKWSVSLPTEAQWEYACRAGTTTAYSAGPGEADLARAAWYWANADGKSHPIGQKAPNDWGLYDMHGNVWEWCADYYDEKYYASSPVADPPGPATGVSRVLRGGAWFLIPGDCRSAFRLSSYPALRLPSSGFRIALLPPQTNSK